MPKIATTISGSFHRHLNEIVSAVEGFRAQGVRVLSPSDPEVVDNIGPFLFVASDRHRSVRLVQDRHLASLCHSNFLWLVCPDGYVGQSASLEVGFAIARGLPIYSEHLPDDLTLRQYVDRVDSLRDAIETATRVGRVVDNTPSLLIDPSTAVDAAHNELSFMGQLLQPVVISRTVDPHPEMAFRQRKLAQILRFAPSSKCLPPV